MLLKNKPALSDFFRRLKFYLFGFIIGIILVSILFKGRGGCKMPATLKLEELNSQQIVYTSHAQCRMKCRSISVENIKTILEKGKINYSKSNVKDSPCPTFAVEGLSGDGKGLRIVLADCDTISKVVTVINLGSEPDTCSCN